MLRDDDDVIPVPVQTCYEVSETVDDLFAGFFVMQWNSRFPRSRFLFALRGETADSASAAFLGILAKSLFLFQEALRAHLKFSGGSFGHEG